MAEQQHRCTAGEWASVKACANDVVTYSCILELLHRIEALENDRRAILNSSSRLRVGLEAAQPAESNYPAKPDSSLVERVAFAITGDSDGLINWKPEARAAIRAVAAWLREQRFYHSGSWAMRLEREAEQ